MGYPRKADSAPSPWQILAICSAKEAGMPVPEISKRTRHSVSSITRWWEKFGHGTRYYEAFLDGLPEDAAPVKFDALFPLSAPQGTFELAEVTPSEIEPDSEADKV